MPLRSHYRPLILGLILLLIAASRAFRLDATITEVTVDEVWSIWQGLGTPAQIIHWTPYDWPPGYYLALAGWRALVGLHPIALRWLSVLAFVIGAAALYRVALRLRGDGVIAMLTYAAFGFLIFLSTELRGYALLLALFPLTIWLTLRYFDHPRWQRAIPLALVMTAMVYLSLTSAAALGALFVFTLIVYGRAIWRWWLPGVMTLILTLPEIISKASIAVSRTQATAGIVLKPFFDALSEMYTQWSGSAFPLWLALIGLAAVLLIRSRRRVGLAVVIWSLLPVALYASNGLLGFFNVRYAWWVMSGIALLLGIGLVMLPRIGRVVIAGVFGVLMFLPIPLNHYQILPAPLGVSFDWLKQHALPGDVVLIDPKCDCGSAEVFDYYSHVYFPQGLTYISLPEGERRIWYITGAHGATPEVRDQVETARTAGIFVGPPEALFRLYEAPPDVIGVAYDNAMRFHGSELLDKLSIPVYHEGDPLHVQLWWSADAPPTLDYSVGLYIFDDTGRLVAQDDSPPSETPTSQWQPRQMYIDERTIPLPDPLLAGRYHLKMAVYWFGDNKRIAAPGVDENGLLPLLDFTVTSWGH